MSKSVRRPSQKISKVSKLAKMVCCWFVERSDAQRVVMQLSGGKKVAAQSLLAILPMSHRSVRDICHGPVAPLSEQEQSPRGSMSVKSRKATKMRARGVDDRDENFPCRSRLRHRLGMLQKAVERRAITAVSHRIILFCPSTSAEGAAVRPIGRQKS